MKSAKTTLVFIFLLSLFVPSRSAHADIAPPPAPQLGGLEPFEYQDTNVQMVYERVEMEIQPITYPDAYYPSVVSRVTVTAYFTMHNNGTALESIQVIFPLESFSNCRMGYGGGNSYTNYFVQEDSFSAVVDGNVVPIQKLVTDHPYKIEDVCNQMNWAAFDVTFPVDEDVVIKVQYRMETLGNADLMQNIEYILETGAGWAGSIQRAYVIVKLPYAATTGNVLSNSTPGYQFLYNEVFWSFENLEPTGENNIQVSIVSPDTWQRILSLRRDLKANAQQPKKWVELAQTYDGISTWHGSNVRNYDYYQKVPLVYEEGIAENSNSAALYSNFAQFLFWDCCYYAEGIDSKYQTRLLSLIKKALALDPKDPIALEMLGILKHANPALTFVAPPTIPPTATSLFTATPSVTPTVTVTPVPGVEPVIVTVIHTKLVEAPTPTRKPSPTATSLPTETFSQDESRNETGSSPIILGALIIFIAGIGAGTFWSKRTGK